MPTVYFETFGCQMNVADSGDLGDVLASRGYLQVSSSRDANLVIVNTCSVRAHAEQRAIARIQQLCAARKNLSHMQKVWVIGCMAQRMGNDLKKKVPGVDRVIGAKAIDTLCSDIDSYLDENHPSSTDTPAGRGVSAFVPIMRGCDNYCSYCIVPYVRGHEQSIPVDEILAKIQTLVEQGVKEVTLLGQNVNSYLSGGIDFPLLLSRVQEISDLKRIRFTTSHPKDFTQQLIGAMAHLPKVCHHLHLPVQSGSNRILELMNRRYTRESYLERIHAIRALVPDVDITTDAMVGFPGESERDYEDTLDLFRQIRFTTAFMFAYSPREGTAACTLPGEVDPDVKQKRLSALIELQTEITKAEYASMVGREVELLVTQRQEKQDGMWMAQDNGCKKALIACEQNLAGAILRARVRSSSGMTLLCEAL